MRRGLLAAIAIAVALGAGLAVGALRDGGAAAATPAPARPTWTGPVPPTAQQKAFRKQYFAAILAGDETVTACGCTAGTRAKDRAAAIAEKRKHAAAAGTVTP